MGERTGSRRIDVMREVRIARASDKKKIIAPKIIRNIWSFVKYSFW